MGDISYGIRTLNSNKDTLGPAILFFIERLFSLWSLEVKKIFFCVCVATASIQNLGKCPKRFILFSDVERFLQSVLYYTGGPTVTSPLAHLPARKHPGS